VNEPLAAQEYVRTWNGTDADDRRAASGIYFVRLRVDDVVTQVEKLSLVQ
jgi:hypothetical protein